MFSFSVVEKTRNHWSHSEERVSRHNHTAGSLTTGFGKGCFEATRWCLPKSQVHKRHTSKCYVLTFHNKFTTSSSVCQRATKSVDSFFLNYQAVQSPQDVLLGGKSDDHNHPEGGQTSLSTLEGDATEICHPKPQMSSSWCQRRKSHRSHHSPSSVGLWTSLQNQCCPDVKLFSKRGKRVLTHFCPKPAGSYWNNFS